MPEVKPSEIQTFASIKVVGVGGAGGSAVNRMKDAGLAGVQFIAMNTDAQALNNSIAEHRIQLGPDITQGLGAGSRPEVGRAAAEETLAEIEHAFKFNDAVLRHLTIKMTRAITEASPMMKDEKAKSLLEGQQAAAEAEVAA